MEFNVPTMVRVAVPGNTDWAVVYQICEFVADSGSPYAVGFLPERCKKSSGEIKSD